MGIVSILFLLVYISLCVFEIRMQKDLKWFLGVSLVQAQTTAKYFLPLVHKPQLDRRIPCLGQSGFTWLRCEFVLGQRLVSSGWHLPTWVILRMSQNNKHNKQLAPSKKQPSHSVWHLLGPSSEANKSQDSPRYLPFQLQV